MPNCAVREKNRKPLAGVVLRTAPACSLTRYPINNKRFSSTQLTLFHSRRSASAAADANIFSRKWFVDWYLERYFRSRKNALDFASAWP